MALITCRDVSFAYEGQTVAEALNFEVHSGDALCIVGENGSGKSTLIKGLLHLKQPSAGIITLDDGLRATEIGYLPQQTIIQRDFPASVYEVVLSGRLSSRNWRPFYSRADKETAEENMQRLGIESLRARCYRELSGGQQQRVLLARALCAAKKVLLLDEPVSGLDPVVTHELYTLMDAINRELHITILMVSHDIQCAAQHASHILHLRKQQIFFGTVQAYKQSEIGQYFLGGGADAANAV